MIIDKKKLGTRIIPCGLIEIVKIIKKIIIGIYFFLKKTKKKK